MGVSEADQLGLLAGHEAATIRRFARFQGRHVATVADGLAHLRIRIAASAAGMDKEAKSAIKSVRDLSHAYKVARHATAPLVQQVGGKLEDILVEVYGNPDEAHLSASKAAVSGTRDSDVAQQLEHQSQLIAMLMSQVEQLQKSVKESAVSSDQVFSAREADGLGARKAEAAEAAAEEERDQGAGVQKNLAEQDEVELTPAALRERVAAIEAQFIEAIQDDGSSAMPFEVEGLLLAELNRLTTARQRQEQDHG